MAADTQRVDKWLWHGRFFKSRSKAAGLCNDGKLRLNGERVGKARVLVRLDDVLTFPQGPHIRVVRIIAISTRRGPAPEAQALYEDLSPPMDKKSKTDALNGAGRRDRGAGRPTKADRGAIDRLKDVWKRISRRGSTDS